MKKQWRNLPLYCCLAFALTLWTYASWEAPRIGQPPVAADGETALSESASLSAASGTDSKSGVTSMSKLTREEIAQLLADNPLTLPAELYDVAPSVTAPYAAGKVKDEALQAAVNRLNALRRIAGLAPVALDAELCRQAQYGAVLLNFQFSHSPAQPADMDDEFYAKGKDATSSSNIASGYTLTGAVDGFMFDSNSGNIDRLGHRRWQLNPAMGKIGFGYAGKYTAEKVFDKSATPGEYDFVAWPASGWFPSAQFKKNQAWSVTLNKSRYSIPASSDLTITLTRESDGREWVFSGAESYTAADSGRYYNVNTGGFGVANCIIFRPDGVEAYDGRYAVDIAGLKDRSGNPVRLSYAVDFFDASEYAGMLSLSGVTVSNGSASVALKGNPGAGAKLYFAAYGANGRFLSAAVQGANAAGDYSAALDLSGAARVAAFLTDANGKPLCRSAAS